MVLFNRQLSFHTQRNSEEEIINAYSHLFASIFSCIIFIICIWGADSVINAFQIYILGALSSWTFFASFLYHSTLQEKKRERNRILDKAAIYLIISGSGLCLALTNLDRIIATIACILIIVLTSTMILNFCISKKESEVFSVVSYVLLSWLCIIPGTGLLGKTMFSVSAGIYWLILAGLFYSIGLLFYVRNKKWFHTIWHVCGILGYSSHLYACTII